ncbi:MAG: hypothetical protein Q4D89_06710 [Arachnia propionica]|uniref:hypothetical protein n=1 Tax=Arachnia propionica TaxID=1750 RepID=UPI00270E79C3|nr:hypothetical protein [Arachnia propionica]
MSRFRRALAGAVVVGLAGPFPGVLPAHADPRPMDVDHVVRISDEDSCTIFGEEHARIEQELLHERMLEQGVPHVVEITDGTMEVVVDEDDEEARAALHRIRGEIGMSPPHDDEETRKEMQRTADHLVSRGLRARVREVGSGLALEVDWSDADVLIALEELDWEQDPMSPQEIREHNEQEEEKVAFLRQHGVTVEVKTSSHGVRYAEMDLDDVTTTIALHEFEHRDGTLSPEHVEKRNRDLEELVARLRAKGVRADLRSSSDGAAHLDVDLKDLRVKAAMAEIRREDRGPERLLFLTREFQEN